MHRITAALILTLWASAPQAQVIFDCGWQAAAQNLAEPWAENSRTFSNGSVRLAVLDTIEPASGAQYLLILSPPYGPLGEPQCKVLGWSEDLGFGALYFDKLTADYDPERGLLFAIPAQYFNPETMFSNGLMLSLELNQATGAIKLDVEFGFE